MQRIKKSTSERQRESYCRAAKYVNDDRRFGVRLSNAFKRKPYCLAVKEEKKDEEENQD